MVEGKYTSYPVLWSIKTLVNLITKVGYCRTNREYNRFYIYKQKFIRHFQESFSYFMFKDWAPGLPLKELWYRMLGIHCISPEKKQQKLFKCSAHLSSSHSNVQNILMCNTDRDALLCQLNSVSLKKSHCAPTKSTTGHATPIHTLHLHGCTNQVI